MPREVFLAMEMGMSIRALKAVTITFSMLAVLGMLQASRALAAHPPDTRPLVEGISIHKAPDGAVTINIAVSGSVPYQTLKLSRPDRLVVDLKGAHQANLKAVYPAESEILARVRASQWKSDPAVVRVVADLKGNPAVAVKRQPSGIRIEIRPQAGDSGRDDASEMADADPFASNRKPSTQSTHEDPSPSKIFPVHRFKDLSASLTAPDLPPHDKLIPVARADLKTASPKKPERRALVSGISVKPNDKGETIEIASTRSVPYRVFQLTNPFRLVIDLKDANNASRQDVYQVDSPVLKRVRVAQWRKGNPPVVRVVAELEGYPVFDVYAQRPGIHVELRSRRQPVEQEIRNPFKYKTEPGTSQRVRPAPQSNQATTAMEGSAASAPGDSLSNLKVIGFIEKKGLGTEAVISDRVNVFIVPKGETFQNTFTVLEISANAVKVKNLKTARTGWIPYTP